MTKKIVFVLIMGIISFSFVTTPVRAGTNDIIIEKLVEKGILSRSEAEELLNEIQKEEEREKQETREVAAEAAKVEADAKGVKVPKWVENIKLKSDLRLRYQGLETDTADGTKEPHRSRGRLRLRVAAETELNPQWKAGFGFASGEIDSRSTNQTLDDAFDTPDLRIDLAYVQYKPTKWLKGIGGKFKNPFWQAKDLKWDTDIRPEGVAAKLDFEPRENLELFITPAFYLVEEFKASKDPVMWALQAGINWKFNENIYLKFAPTFYATNNFRESAFPNRGRTSNNLGNTTVPADDEGGKYVFEYNTAGADAEIGFGLSGPIPSLAIFGQFAQSGADDALRPPGQKQGEDANQAWLAGIKFGHKKVKERWQWQGKYNYREIEKDAWPDFLPDSDFYGGSTNAKGHEIEFVLGIHDNVTLGADYYQSEIIKPLADKGEQKEDLIQVDMILKW